MKWQAVDSTSIEGVGYDPGRGKLGVKFLHGGTYVYFDVSPSIFAALLEADSKGKFLHEHILDRYRYRRL